MALPYASSKSSQDGDARNVPTALNRAGGKAHRTLEVVVSGQMTFVGMPDGGRVSEHHRSKDGDARIHQRPGNRGGKKHHSNPGDDSLAPQAARRIAGWRSSFWRSESRRIFGINALLDLLISPTNVDVEAPADQSPIQLGTFTPVASHVLFCRRFCSQGKNVDPKFSSHRFMK